MIGDLIVMYLESSSAFLGSDGVCAGASWAAGAWAAGAAAVWGTGIC